MKDNKINVDLIVPNIDEKFNLFLPINKTIGEIIIILNNAIHDLDNDYPISKNLSLLNVVNNKIYDINIELSNTDIKNGSILALI